jgi:nucleoside-triphosphatase THEP1
MNLSHEHFPNCQPHLAAIYSEYGNKADIIIDQIINRLHAEDKNVVGIRQCISDAPNSTCAAQLQNIENGEYHRITRALSSQSNGWNIDIEAIEKMAHRLADSLNSNLDLVIVNRFGRLESDGGGFCCVIQRALELEIPLLTVVNPLWQQSWHDYTDGLVITLPANRASVLEWCYSSIECSAQRKPPIVQRQQSDAPTA